MNQSRRFRHVLSAVCVLLLTAFLLPGIASAAEEEREYEDLVMDGDNVCTRCHEGLPVEAMAAIAAGYHDQ